MSYCQKCGVLLEDGAQFCSACGAPAAPAAPYGQQPNPNPMYGAPNGIVPPLSEFDPADVQQNKVMAILAYFGLLVLVPIFTAKESKFARFHANQGLVLLICNAAYSVVYSILSGILNAIHLRFLTGIFFLVYIVFFVFAIIGIVNAAGGKASKLPIIGDFQILK